MDLFKTSDKRAFLYTVDMLNEGMHIDDISCIIMFRKTKSPIVYLQQLGRALTSNSKKERILIFDFVANHINLNVYEKTNESVIQNIINGISNPSRQIMVTDYASEDLEILERLKDLLSGNWRFEEDQILVENYNKGKGIDKCMELLPERKRDSIIRRAKKLGLAKIKQVYGIELDEDIEKYYLQPGGHEYLKEIYPNIKWQSLVGRANRMGFKTRHVPKQWTEEDDDFLRKNPELPMEVLAEKLGVRTTQVIARRNTLRISYKNRYKWTPEDDEILKENSNLSSSEIQSKYFPFLSIQMISSRRQKLNCNRRLIWDKETIDLFSELYRSGGSKLVINHERFAHMNKNAICGAAIRYEVKAPSKVIPWTEEDLNIIKQFILEGKSFNNKCELLKVFPNRTPTSIRHMVSKIKKEIA